MRAEITDHKLTEAVSRAILDAERAFRGSEPIGDTEWANYWSPGGPTALPSLIAMRGRAALAAVLKDLTEYISCSTKRT